MPFSIKLRHQIYLMFLLILAMVGIILLIVMQVIGNVNRSIKQEALTDSTNHLSMGVENHWETLKQQANILAYNNYLLSFVEAETPGRRLTDYRRILTFINSMEETNTNIDRFVYINDENLCIANALYTNFKAINYIRESYDYDFMAGNPDQCQYFRFVEEPGTMPQYMLVTPSHYDSFAEKPLLMLLLIDMEPIVTMVRNLYSQSALYVLLDDRGSTIAGSWSEEQLRDGGNRMWRAALDGGEPPANLIRCQVEIPQTGWRIVAVSDISIQGTDDQMSIRLIAFILVILTALMVAFLLMINRNIVNPIMEITGFVQSIGDDYSTKRLTTTKANEIGILAKAINRMLNNIHQLNENMAKTQQNLYLTEISKQNMRLAALQSQINPHFLYNTLDCIRGIALKERIRSIADMSSSVSKIFRYSIKGRDYVQIRDEINCIRDYMLIIGIRHNQRFRLELHLDEDIMAGYIPKMILQPIVENAVFHGLEPKKGPGVIEVTVARCGQGALFLVRDDGVGFEGEQLALLRASLNDHLVMDTELMEKKSIGIMNIYQRLSLMYGGNFTMEVDSERNGGTAIRIVLGRLLEEPRST